MAIPFLQPEDDEAARLQHAATQAGQPGHGPVSPGLVPGSSSGGGLNLPPPPPSPLIASGSIPIPGSPAVAMVSPPPPSGTSTAVQTPLLGPGTLMHGDQLVQLFYEALYRYSRGDTPSTPISQSPQSSSCSPFTTGYYNTPPPGGQVFFPQTPSGVLPPPRTPNAAPVTGGGRGGARIFFGQPTPSPSGSSSHSSQHSAGSPDASLTTTPASCASSAAAPIFHQFPSSFSGSSADGGTATSPAAPLANQTASWPDDGSESSESDSSQPSSSASSEAATGSTAPAGGGCSSHCLGLGHLHHHRLQHHHHHHHQQPLDVGGGAGPSGFIPPHLDFMAGREQLQEFAGKIPQRKKKSKAGSKSKKAKFLEQTLVWPTLAVTATLIALGCGLLAAR